MKCVVMIDCFEVFCERPKSLMARAQTNSNYKHHNTVKYLIGIAQGVITFIQKDGVVRMGIGLFRQTYVLLKSTLPINMIRCPETSDISIINKIVTICCALCNCCQSVVPFD